MPFDCTPDPKFDKWARGFSGMDGGNLTGPLWFCGIEFGGNDERPFELDRARCYNFDDMLVPCWNDYFKEKNPRFTTWQYDRKIAKIACEFLGSDISNWKEYMRTRLFTEDGEVLKLNLYPINFSNISDSNWTERHYKRTGFKHKILYKAWCIQDRFPMLNALVNRHSPKVLVCTGISHKHEFRIAFAPHEKLFDAEIYSTFFVGKHKVEAFKAANHSTQVFITPFLGPGGIMSNEHLSMLGKAIRKRVT